MPGPILALDTATTTGWAHARPGEEPVFGSRNFSGPGGNGEVIGKFRAWLLETCYRIKPRVVCFESPYVPRAPKSTKPGDKPFMLNPLTLRLLFALAGEVEAVAWQLRIECLEATTGEICKFFTGTAFHGGRDNKKTAIITRARQYGWQVEDDNAADAVALWAMAENIFDPRASSRRGDGDLSLPLPEPIVKTRRKRNSGKPAKPAAPTQQPLFV